MMRRSVRHLAGAVGALVVVAVAGCASIPTSGPVVAGPEVGLAEPDFVVNPAGPQDGALPGDILAGFMVAVRAPQGGFQVAREFLTEDLAQDWNPDAQTFVRSGGATMTEVFSAEDAARIDYAVDTVAEVDDRGRYTGTPVTARTLTFAFALEDEQWRISEAPDGVVLSAAAFERAFQETALYFVEPSGRYLVPELRWFAIRTTTPTRAVEELLLGPSDWLQRAVASEFPPGTTLGDQAVEIRTGGTAYVDLSAEAGTASAQALVTMRTQLAATLGVTDVQISAAGVPLDVPVLGSVPPTIDPEPSGTVLIGTGEAFGFGTENGIVEVDGISAAVVDDAATSAVLAHDQGSAAYFAGDGSIRTVSVADPSPIVVDTRPRLLPPSLDTYGFVWTAQTDPGAPVTAVALDGTVIPVSADLLPADFVIESLAVSRDGARLLVGGTGALGPGLTVFGISRSDGVPAQLTGPLELLAPEQPILDVAWVSDDTVVVLSAAPVPRVQAVVLGGPTTDLGAIDGAVALAGGRGGLSGVRALADGTVWAPDSAGAWTNTGTTAVFLGVQQ